MEIPTKINYNPFKYIRRTIMDALLMAFQSEWIFYDGQRDNNFQVVIDDIENKNALKGSKLVITERYAQNESFVDGKSLLVVGRGSVQGERLSFNSGFTEAETLIKMTGKKTYGNRLRYVARIETKAMSKTDVDDLAWAVWYILEFFHDDIRIAAGLNTIGVPVVGEIIPENTGGQGAENRFFTCAIEVPMEFGIDYHVFKDMIEAKGELTVEPNRI